MQGLNGKKDAREMGKEHDRGFGSRDWGENDLLKRDEY